MDLGDVDGLGLHVASTTIGEDDMVQRTFLL